MEEPLEGPPRAGQPMNRDTLKLTLAIVALVGAAIGWLDDRPVPHLPGVLAPDEPRQEPPADDRPWQHLGYEIRPLADYSLRARVLSATRYRWDRGADLAPVDLAVGWGEMSDSALLERFERKRHHPTPVLGFRGGLPAILGIVCPHAKSGTRPHEPTFVSDPRPRPQASRRLPAHITRRRIVRAPRRSGGGSRRSRSGIPVLPTRGEQPPPPGRAPSCTRGP